MQEPVEVGRERDSLDKKLDIQGVLAPWQCFFLPRLSVISIQTLFELISNYEFEISLESKGKHFPVFVHTQLYALYPKYV